MRSDSYIVRKAIAITIPVRLLCIDRGGCGAGDFPAGSRNRTFQERENRRGIAGTAYVIGVAACRAAKGVIVGQWWHCEVAWTAVIGAEGASCCREIGGITDTWHWRGRGCRRCRRVCRRVGRGSSQGARRGGVDGDGAGAATGDEGDEGGDHDANDGKETA